jgi:hypothetical protein
MRPDQPPAGGEHRDRSVAEPGDNTLRAWRNMVADHAITGRLKPGEAVQVVALGAGQLEGTRQRTGWLPCLGGTRLDP